MITPNFLEKEFTCKDGTEVPKKYHNNRLKLCQQLEIIRAEIKTSIKGDGAFRTKSYNLKVDGKSRSQHLLCKAFDLHTSLPPKELYKIILDLIKSGKLQNGGVGLYRWGVHYDIGRAGRRW